MKRLTQFMLRLGLGLLFFAIVLPASVMAFPPGPGTGDPTTNKGPSYVYGLAADSCNGGMQLTFPFKGVDSADGQEKTYYCLTLSQDSSTYKEVDVAQNHACDRTDVVKDGVAMPVGFSVTRNGVQSCFYFQQDKVKANYTIGAGTGGGSTPGSTNKKNKTSTIPNQLGTADQLGIPGVQADSNAFASALRAVFLIIGSLAVIIIVVAGIQYVVSAGNPDQTRKAKDAILYAVVGLIISLLAVTIVSFVTGRLS